ncbi:MAG: hypothetical protein HY854_19070 [Burkholderiales bacterium]|nr:hypothetical protein [Burkholderiales bacterium]
MKLRFLFIATALLAAGAAHAQAVYRCGNEYRQSPCPEGKAVAAEDPRTAAEARKAEAQVKQNQKAADAMEKSRLAEEKKVAGPAMVVTGQRPAASAASAPKKPAQKKAKGRKKEPEHFTAMAPPSKK